MEEKHLPIVSQLELSKTIPSSITTIGENESPRALNFLDPLLSPKNETNSVNPSQSLKSHVKPHALLEKPFGPRVLKIRKEDFDALCQVISEFKEQL
jgi:hypothetical protein